MNDIQPKYAKYLPALDDIAAGAGAKASIAKVGSWASFRRALDSDPELSKQYERALELQGDVDADAVVDVYDMEPDPQRARAKSDAHRWRASVRNRRRYGAQIDVQIDAGPNLRAAMELATQRVDVRPISDQRAPALAQVIDAQYESIQEAPDYESVKAPSLAQLLGDADD